jgi:multiple sugar transport system permease protein
MNWLQISLLLLVAIFVLLLFVQQKFAWTYARTTALLLVSAVFLLPFAWLISASFKDKTVLQEYTFLPPPSLWSSGTVDTVDPDTGATLTTTRPAGINLDNFRELLKPRETLTGVTSFWRHVINSLFLASTGTMLSLFFSSLGGYALAKYKFRGRNAIVAFMLASLVIPGVVLLAPGYKLMVDLGWIDSYKALLIPGMVSVFGIFLFRQAMVGIPDDIIEAGRIDGCSEFRIYLQLMMPLVRPMIGAFVLITFLGSWNNFLGPQIFLQSEEKLPLPVILNQYVGLYSRQYGVFLAGTLLSILPPAILFLALQREFVAGLTSGAVKG